MRRYTAFGRRIFSELALSELERNSAPSAAEADDGDILTIRRAAVTGPMPDPPEWRIVEVSDEQTYLAWTGIGRVAVRGHNLIEVDPLADVDQAVLGLVLLGPVAAAALHRSGDLVLHGSAIALSPDRAILFLGDNGAGKSTLAGTFLKAGHSVVTDDVIALRIGADGIPWVRPGFGAMKLSRAAIDALSPLPGELLPAVPANAAKLRLRLAEFDVAPKRLSHIFVLRRGDPTTPVPMQPGERLRALLRYSYMLKFGEAALRGVAVGEHFTGCVAVADRVPVTLLSVPDGVERLSETVATVRAYLDSMAGAETG